MSDINYKQVILVRQDLKLPKGKLAAQAAHASVEAVLRSDEEMVKRWRMEGMAKIVIKVKDEKELSSFGLNTSFLLSQLFFDAFYQ